MRIFVDTAALIAILNRDDKDHPAAKQTWHSLLDSGEGLVTSNYVLLETMAVVQRRLGVDAVRDFRADARPALEVLWVSQSVHDATEVSLLLSGRRDLSLVDCVSFELMRRHDIRTAFTFDPHFREQGFKCLPAR
jgi:predicted nucleic acid-binding protein